MASEASLSSTLSVAVLVSDFKLLPVKPCECNKWDFDVGAELDVLSAECRLRRDRIEYSDPSSETVCSCRYTIVAEGL